MKDKKKKKKDLFTVLPNHNEMKHRFWELRPDWSPSDDDTLLVLNKKKLLGA